MKSATLSVIWNIPAFTCKESPLHAPLRTVVTHTALGQIPPFRRLQNGTVVHKLTSCYPNFQMNVCLYHNIQSANMPPLFSTSETNIAEACGKSAPKRKPTDGALINEPICRLLIPRPMFLPAVRHSPPRSVPDISIAFLIISVIHTLGQDFKTFPQVKRIARVFF